MTTKIGIGCIVNKKNKVLLGKRLNSHGTGHWSFPGGHLDEGENPFDCALRETLEETGLIVTNPKLFNWSFDFFIEKNCNYITLFVLADYVEGEPITTEPHKNDAWLWFPKDQLPTPLFKPIKSLANYGYREEVLQE